jgi:mono/diheme cytochrome c family protein
VRRLGVGRAPHAPHAPRAPRAAVAGLAAFAALAVAACNPDDVVHRVGWFATMRHQRSIKPYARPIPAVAGTVPITGLDPTVIRTMVDRLANPRTWTSESINRGRFLYETYCLVCHGVAGRGDGPISATNGQTPPGPFFGVRSLVNDTIARRTDGYIYAVIVSGMVMGRGLMPVYGDKVRGDDRWDLVNYVRTLQAEALGGRVGRGGKR